jgi:hypothetical protein
MKTFKSFIFLSVLFVFLIVTPVLGDNWVEYGKEQNGNVYSYQKDSIVKKSNTIVQVWGRMDYSEKGREIYNQPSSIDKKIKWIHIYYSIHQIEIDCEKRQGRVLPETNCDYDTYGNQLYNGYPYMSDWFYIVPETSNDNLRMKLCKKSK